MRSGHASKRSSIAGFADTAATGRCSRCRGDGRSSSTTASRPGVPRAPPCRIARLTTVRGRVVLAVPVAAPETLAELAASPTRWSHWHTPTRMYGSVRGTTSSPRRVTTRCGRLAAARTNDFAQAAPHCRPAPSTTRSSWPRNVCGARTPRRARGARGLASSFAHGSGSSRLSPRNRFVAERLQDAGLATLLFDLLPTKRREPRATSSTSSCWRPAPASPPAGRAGSPAWRGCAVGYFGASTGAAAALLAAAEDPRLPRWSPAAVGRTWPAPRLPRCLAPTLLIVGGADPAVRELNEEAARRLRCEHRSVIVPGQRTSSRSRARSRRSSRPRGGVVHGPLPGHRAAGPSPLTTCRALRDTADDEHSQEDTT